MLLLCCLKIKLIMNGVIHMDIHQAITTRIHQLAEERDKTVTEIARRGGIKQSTISMIMNGQSKHPKVSTVHAYSNGCGITLSEFFDSPLFKYSVDDLLDNEEKEFDQIDSNFTKNELEIIKGSLNIRKSEIDLLLLKIERLLA